MPRIKARDLHDKAMREEAEYRREYEALKEKRALIATMLNTRQKADLAQMRVDEHMSAKQSLVPKSRAANQTSPATP